HRRTGAVPQQTALRKRPVFRAIGGRQSLRGGARVRSLLTFSRQRRGFSIAGVDDQRSSESRDHASPRPPEIVICAAGLSFDGAIATVGVVVLEQFLLIRSCFLRREKLFTGQICGPFERRDRRVVP